MRILGIIKVPERIARLSACIAVLYLQVCTEVGHKTYCSTVRGLFTPGSQGGLGVITTDVCVCWGVTCTGGGVGERSHG